MPRNSSDMNLDQNRDDGPCRLPGRYVSSQIVSSRLGTRSHSVIARKSPGSKLALLILCVVIFLTGFPVSGSCQEFISGAELDRRRAKIASLSESDRAELIRKFQDFKGMTEAERNHLRTLHQKVSANPSLMFTMQRYCEWLKDLDVAQRERLRAADTPEKKRLAVQRIRDELEKRREESSRTNDSRESEVRKFGFTRLATSLELKELMGTLETYLTKSSVIDPGQLEKVRKLAGTARYKRVLKMFGEVRKSKVDGQQSVPKVPEEFQAALKKIVPEPLIRKEVAERFGGLQRVFLWLNTSLLEEAKRELADAEGDELREALFHSLAPQTQTDFLQTPPESQAAFLDQIHLEDLRLAFREAFDLPRAPLGDGSRFPRDGQSPNRGDQPIRNGGRGAGGPFFGGPRRDGPPPEEGQRPREPENRRESRPEGERKFEQP